MLRGGKGEYPPFYEKPLCRVLSYTGDGKARPRVEAKEDDLTLYLRLCKAGYANSVLEAMQLPARVVLQALSFEKFLGDYEAAWVELNKK